MEEEILRAILQEIKGTNQRLENFQQSTGERLENLDLRLVSLEQNTNKWLDGLYTSMQVLQQAFADVRENLNAIKEFLASRVIWVNDSITISTKEGSTIEGIISSNRLQKL